MPMKDLDEHKKIAVLIDADNAQHSKIKLILAELSTHGHLVVKRAYGDWSSDYLKNWKHVLNELAVQPIQQFAYTIGKNSSDASMIIDAMDLLYAKNFDAFALVSSDSDFTKLASRLRESEIFVFGVGERKTPLSFRNACDDFIFTENLGEMGNDAVLDSASSVDFTDAQIVGFLTKAWEQYKDEQGWANVAPVGALIKRQHPDFDPRSYKASNFSELIEKLNGYFEMERNPGKGGVIIVSYRPRKIQEQ